MRPSRTRTFAAVLGCLSITLPACAPSESAETTESTESGPLAGLEAELDTLVPTLLDAFSVPGAGVGIIHDGEIWMKRGFGHADAASGRVVDAGVAFNIGSISKTVASWGVMRLVESGDIDLDAPVDTYLTRWQLPAVSVPPSFVMV